MRSPSGSLLVLNEFHKKEEMSQTIRRTVIRRCMQVTGCMSQVLDNRRLNGGSGKLLTSPTGT
jgi:hypothetical protein